MAPKQITRGVRIKIFPNAAQAARLDLWRRRCVSLWNLLLGMEMAAYDGDKFRPELKWREIWAAVIQENHALAHEGWLNGKTVRLGKRKGAIIPPMTGAAPEPPTADFLRKIQGGRISGDVPKLFIWENELLKVMARLKKVPLTGWIGDIHSHAAQAVCRDLCGALRKYLEARSRPDLDVGFPVFKGHGYAAGSVAFVNTQVSFDWNGSVRITNGVGEIHCGPIGKIPSGAKLCACRASREGEQWWLSAQFKFDAPEQLPVRNRACGVKVAAAAVYTIFDGEAFMQFMSRRPTPREEALFSIKDRKASRKRRKTNGARSNGWFKAQAVRARASAQCRNRTRDVIHKGSRAIVNEFDHIVLDKMSIKPMMAKPKSEGKGKRQVRKNLMSKSKPKGKSNRQVRKIMMRAAMYDAALKVVYKATETGSVVERTHVLFPSTQICSACGKINVNMASGRRTLVCECGFRMKRQRNAAVNLLKQASPIETAK